MTWRGSNPLAVKWRHRTERVMDSAVRRYYMKIVAMNELNFFVFLSSSNFLLYIFFLYLNCYVNNYHVSNVRLFFIV